MYHSILQCNNYLAPRQYTSSSIPIAGLIDKNQGTIEAWVSVGSSLRSGVADKYVFSTYGDERYTNTIALRHTRDNKWHALISADYANVSEVKVDDNLTEGWHLFSLRWNTSEMSLFIDGVKVGSIASPKLVSSVPEKFNIGIGPKLNIIDNGYVTSGDNSNFPNATYDTSDYTSAPAGLKANGYEEFENNKYYIIDVNRKYQINGSFKSVGPGGLSKLYYGISPYDADKNFIECNMAYYYNDTKTELDRDLNSGDTIVYLKSAVNWKKSSDDYFTRYLAIYNYKDYSEYSYTRNVYAFNDSDQNVNTITLNSPYSGSMVPKGTKIANSHDDSTYIYTASGGGIYVPNNWTSYTGSISGISFYDVYSNFRYGTKYVQLIVLVNDEQDSTYSLVMDDLELKDLTDTILDTAVDDVCISNIARTDADVLSRYQAYTVFPEDMNTTYRMNN